MVAHASIINITNNWQMGNNSDLSILDIVLCACAYKICWKKDILVYIIYVIFVVLYSTQITNACLTDIFEQLLLYYS